MTPTPDGDSDAASDITTTVDHRVGFHFSCISRLRTRRAAECTRLLLKYRFTSDFVVDPYELDLYDHVYTYLMHPLPDLELPVFAADDSLTDLTLVVSPVLFDAGQPSLNVTLPLHSRYGTLSHSSNPDEAYETLRFPQPSAAWECTSSGKLIRYVSRL